jgi:hypothetical protein
MGILTLAGLCVLGCGAPEAPAPEAPPSAASGPELSEEQQAFVDMSHASALAEVEPQAQQGDAASQRKLGVMYYLGHGVAQDYGVASEWLTRSAEQGDHVAQMMIGAMYAEGQGVPRDLVRAHSWLSLSASQGNENARQRIRRLAPEMTPDQIASATQSARDWKARHPS